MQKLKDQGYYRGSVIENPTSGIDMRDPRYIEELQLHEEKKKLAEKVKSYAKNVKEMYWPKISEEKRLELEHQIIKQSSKSREHHQTSILDNNQRLPLRRINPAYNDNNLESGITTPYTNLTKNGHLNNKLEGSGHTSQASP